MEILDKLPDELKWNVIKFWRHPCADMINALNCDSCGRRKRKYHKCGDCNKTFCVRCVKYEKLNGYDIITEQEFNDMLVCKTCLTLNFVHYFEMYENGINFHRYGDEWMYICDLGWDSDS